MNWFRFASPLVDLCNGSFRFLFTIFFDQRQCSDVDPVAQLQPFSTMFNFNQQKTLFNNVEIQSDFVLVPTIRRHSILMLNGIGDDSHLHHIDEENFKTSSIPCSVGTCYFKCEDKNSDSSKCFMFQEAEWNLQTRMDSDDGFSNATWKRWQKVSLSRMDKNWTFENK